ncbi:MAG: hypothetical protein JW818_15485 [Pirellulales bacterium]|nr:hypothetical protein [Pirellulales bacterium]
MNNDHHKQESARPSPDSSSSSPKPPPRRPWWQLHRSTWVVMGVVAVVLVFIVVPASPPRHVVYSYSIVLNPDGGLRHGWPWDFARHTESFTSPFDSPSPDVDKAPWTQAKNWVLTSGVTDWSPLHLVGDVLVALGILVTVGAGFEWWRRRRHRAWQFSLRELFVFTCVVAGVLAWWQSNAMRYQREMALCERIHAEPGWNNTRFVYDGPVWLRRLLGGRNTNVLITAEQFNMDATQKLVKNPMPDERAFAYLNEAIQACPKLASVIFCVKGEIDDQLEPLAKMKRLRDLVIYGRRFTATAMNDIGQCANLEDLILRCEERPEGDLTPLAKLTRLKSLRLHWRGLTGHDFDPLAELPCLESLEVYHLSDEDLEHLPRFKQLRRLLLVTKNATPEAIARLKEALPDCEIDQLEGRFQD